MDMHDPKEEAKTVSTEQPLNEAPAAAAGAGMEVAATDNEPDATAALDAEEMMADALSQEQNDDNTPKTAQDVLEAATALLEKSDEELSAENIRRLRQLFNMLHKQAPAAEGDTTEEAQPATDELEVRFNEVIETLRTRKAQWTAQQEQERAKNLERKNEIIGKILALAQDTDNVNRTFEQYRQLQEEFTAIGEVPATDETGVWKRFQDARECYSDNLKINKELRDYDFRRNLAEKEALLSEAESLTAHEDVIAAYRRLQDLHNKWRLIGPVAKELRDQIWNKFRDFSAEVNKRYQAYFEARKAREAENEAAKTALCERIEAIDFENVRTFAAWDELTNQIIGLQEEWKTLGFASKKMNRELFARFRARCDAFFAAKAEYFRKTREELAANLAAKTALAERAEQLAESKEWRKAADEFVEMQKQWKTIGSVPKKHSDNIWKRFTAACDKFFDAKKKAGSGTRAEENANLKTKREIIGELSALATDGANKNEAVEKLRELQQRWNNTGHVPFREKDKLYEAYRSAINAVREHFELAERGARRERFQASVQEIEGDTNKMLRERERLVRTLESRKAELRTYQNNLGFLSAKSKSGDTLVRDLNRRIERLMADIDELAEKVKLLDQKLS